MTRSNGSTIKAESFLDKLNRDVLSMLASERKLLTDLAERCLLPGDDEQRDLARKLLFDLYGGRVKDPTMDRDGLHVVWQDSLTQSRILYLRAASEMYQTRTVMQAKRHP